jgi:general secretion pathway protein M
MKAQLLARWQAFSPRDQRVLSTLAGVIGLLVFISLAVTPALNTMRDSDNRRVQIAQQQAQMLALQAQAQALQTRTVLSRDEALRQLQSITPNKYMQLQTQGTRVSVQLKAMPAADLALWLAQARQQAQTLPTEANLTRNAASTTATATTTATVWDGNLVLNLPTRGAAP